MDNLINQDHYSEQQFFSDLQQEMHDTPASELKLMKFELLYKILAEQTSDAFLIHDVNGRFIEVSYKTARYLGYTREELLKMNVTDVETDIKPDEALDKWMNFVPGDVLVSKGHHRRKDGSIFPVEVNLRCGVFNDKKYFIGVVKDITEKEVTEEKLNSL